MLGFMYRDQYDRSENYLFEPKANDVAAAAAAAVAIGVRDRVIV